MPPVTERDWWTRQQVADYLHWTVDTVHARLTEARTATARGEYDPERHFPLPDLYAGRTPLWRPETIHNYAERFRNRRHPRHRKSD
jgi:hypothetical protein